MNGPVAQSVEQRIENPCVGGSIPPQATIQTVGGKRKRATKCVAVFFIRVFKASYLTMPPAVQGFVPRSEVFMRE